LREHWLGSVQFVLVTGSGQSASPGGWVGVGVPRGKNGGHTRRVGFGSSFTIRMRGGSWIRLGWPVRGGVALWIAHVVCTGFVLVDRVSRVCFFEMLQI
jgi:hypothetical protein